MRTVILSLPELSTGDLAWPEHSFGKQQSPLAHAKAVADKRCSANLTPESSLHHGPRLHGALNLHKQTGSRESPVTWERGRGSLLICLRDERRPRVPFHLLSPNFILRIRRLHYDLSTQADQREEKLPSPLVSFHWKFNFCVQSESTKGGWKGAEAREDRRGRGKRVVGQVNSIWSRISEDQVNAEWPVLRESRFPSFAAFERGTRNSSF